MNPIYLDYNATTPLDPGVIEVMKPYLDVVFGNPSSLHEFGAAAAQGVMLARTQVAALLNCFPDEIVFTGGGTESNNFAIKGIAYAHRDRGNHIITSSIEHPAVSEVCCFLEEEGFEITRVGVDPYGIVNPDEVRQAIRPETILISIMHANNETGSIQPVEEISRIARQNGVFLHTDAAQSTGKIRVDAGELGADLISVAGHKLYAPKGVGALFIKRGVKLSRFMHGADHEGNRRAGTENVIGIVGLGKAAEIATSPPRHLLYLRDLLHDGIREALPEVRLNGHPGKRLPNTLSLGFPGVEAGTLLQAMRGIAASAGAACHAGEKGVSGVLTAMHVPAEYAMGTIRFSVGRMTTEEEIRRAVPIIVQAYREIRDTGIPLSNAGKTITPPHHHTTTAPQNHTTAPQNHTTAPPNHHITSPPPHLPPSLPPHHHTATPPPIRLTEYTKALGCACKIRPQLLEEMLKTLPAVTDPKVLVGPATSDDASVFELNGSQALVQTVDMIPPVVDDPYAYGMIAAANAISDIYAMGAVPLYALNIVGFPVNRLPMDVLEEILKGASEKAAEAGIQILGGHSVELTEPLFGLSVTGLVHPDKVLKNRGAKPGDALIITKPLGTGILTTAMKRGMLNEVRTGLLISTMAELNRKAAGVMPRFPVHACTDVTGFGFLGHLREMVSGEPVNVHIGSRDIPLLDGVEELAAQGIIPGGTRENLDHVRPDVTWGQHISDTGKLILCDAQTSGGLLLAVDGQSAEGMVDALREAGAGQATIVGFFTKGEGKIIVETKA